MYIIGEVRSFAFGTNTAKFSELVKDGWLPCDGRQLENKDYKQLFEVIGNSWGSALLDKYFNLPNFSGAFLRGASIGEQSNDPEFNSRLPPRADLNLPAQHAGNTISVGSYQTHSIGAHAHNYNEFIVTGNSAGQSESWNHHGKTQTSSTSPYGGRETRPVNFSVLYLIYTGEKIQSVITDVLNELDRDLHIA